MHLHSKAAFLLLSVIGTYSCADSADPEQAATGAEESAREELGTDQQAISAVSTPTPDSANQGASIDSSAAFPPPGFPQPGPTTTDTPIGLAFEIDNGVGVPLKLRKGQRFYVNQIDMRASITASTDEGVSGLATSGDFAAANWSGTALADESFVDQPNADGTSTRRRFYRGAKWMSLPSTFLVEQIDSAGHSLGTPITVGTGLENKRLPCDDFFIRRLRAIQWTYDCPTSSSCTGASSFGEEALIELRNANDTKTSFKLRANATALRVTWSAKPGTHYKIPVQQVAAPQWDYGFGMDLVTLTPPAADGTYAAGQQVTFQFTLKDGSGQRLHAPGVMPSYADVLAGNEPSGIQYYRAPLEPTATYYRRKHREKQLIMELTGPAQSEKPIYDVVDINQAIDFQTGVVTSAHPATNGLYAAVTGVPSFLAIFGGPAFWSLPSTDTWTFTLPADAQPGTYRVVLKGRRAYLGEDIPTAKVVEIQVGSPAHTTTPLATGHCDSCHNGGASFKRVLHGLDDRGSCTGCHAPLTFEREGPIYVRAHFIHSRSGRFDAPLDNCKTCHLQSASIQRTSKSACLSCHKSYPSNHVQSFGPITDMYIGGGDESFQQCSTTCHTTHPGSGF